MYITAVRRKSNDSSTPRPARALPTPRCQCNRHKHYHSIIIERKHIHLQTRQVGIAMLSNLIMLSRAGPGPALISYNLTK